MRPLKPRSTKLHIDAVKGKITASTGNSLRPGKAVSSRENQIVNPTRYLARSTTPHPSQIVAYQLPPPSFPPCVYLTRLPISLIPCGVHKAHLTFFHLVDIQAHPASRTHPACLGPPFRSCSGVFWSISTPFHLDFSTTTTVSISGCLSFSQDHEYFWSSALLTIASISFATSVSHQASPISSVVAPFEPNLLTRHWSPSRSGHLLLPSFAHTPILLSPFPFSPWTPLPVWRWPCWPSSAFLTASQYKRS